ncbi:hypothetical protein GCM10010178_66390 [Lentzea flava]|uniref:Uncharacterized protein n=1 Tax=Lentzea flava TaxID=103732 RepID=A0ABQ2V398_9PSEU|nr:hypothetical protein GCM10010178_66390 [Lentzea flava]
MDSCTAACAEAEASELVVGAAIAGAVKAPLAKVAATANAAILRMPRPARVDLDK